MIFGYSLIGLALIATFSAAVLFVASGIFDARVDRSRASVARKPRTFANAARSLAIAAALFVAAASAYLVSLIASHQFQVAYVAEYSARRSDPRYLLAAFWGGQEGSILLWTLWTSILAALLAFKADGKEAKVWPALGLIQSMLLVLVLVKCPFRVTPGPAPTDGQGLNPLLENQWMVIHPPILFLGFASLAVPWAWSVYALLHRDWDGWIRRMFPWALFSFAVLGFGIALGGYWAYETLGWGGFWGWDPVEVSSLVPWLFLIALLHGAHGERFSGGHQRANLLLGSMPLAFMCYGTFLTRTGLLADFSVHSFSSLGKDGFALLLGMIAVVTILPIALLAARARQIPTVPAFDDIRTRGFGLFLASIVLVVLGVLTAAGMSAPLITKLWIHKGAAAQPNFYNQATYPLSILMLLIMAVTPFLSRRQAGVDRRTRPLRPAVLAGFVGMTAFFALGGHKPWMVLLFGVSVFTALANLTMVRERLSLRGKQGPVTRTRQRVMSTGGYVAHIGAALVLAGVACLVAFSRQALHVMLVKNQPVQALGYKLTYLGMTSQPYDRANALRIRVERGGRAWEARPHLFIAPWGGSDQLFANPPDIRNFFWGDLYLAHYRGPYSLGSACPNDGVTLHPNDSFDFGGYHFAYHGLQWSDDVTRAVAAGEDPNKLPSLRIHADIDVTYRGETYPLRPQLVIDPTTMSKHTVATPIPGPPNTVIALNDVQLPETAMISTSNLPDPREMVEVDLSTKPMVQLVWLGTILYTVGGLMAYRRRAREFVRPESDNLDDASSTPPPAPKPVEVVAA